MVKRAKWLPRDSYTELFIVKVFRCPKMITKFKMADFLLGLDTMRLFFQSCDVTCVYQISYNSVKHTARAASLKFCRGHYRVILPHPFLGPISDLYFHPSDVRAKCHVFSRITSPSKIASCFMVNNASLWQQHSVKTHSLYNKASSMSEGFSDQI